MLIDTHAHLTDDVYGGAEEIVRTLRADGLERVVCVGYDLPSSRASAALADRYADVYFAAGIHPSETGRLPSGWTDELLTLSRREKCVAIGEIGLDYHYEDTDRVAQADALVGQFDVVRQAGKPVIFHVRDSYEDMLRLVKAHRNCFTAGGVLHCFSGSLETALQYVDMGFYVSFTGSITFKNAVKFPAIIAAIPFDRILVETDCPYLAPVPYRGQTNKPAYVRYVAAKIAEIRNVTVEQVIEQTTQNAYRLFTALRREG